MKKQTGWNKTGTITSKNILSLLKAARKNLMKKQSTVYLEINKINHLFVIPKYKNYGLTRCGDVYSFKAKKYLKPRFIGAPNPKLAVDLFRNGKRHTCYIHNLITLSFHEKVSPNPEANRFKKPIPQTHEKFEQ